MIIRINKNYLLNLFGINMIFSHWKNYCGKIKLNLLTYLYFLVVERTVLARKDKFITFVSKRIED